MIADEKDRVRVSIYSVCYNQARYIRQCVESILAQQTDFRFEAIFIDDCSTDGTSEILAEYAAKYPGKIIHLRHSRNRYAENYDAMMNSFFPIAKGEYVACLEGDDFWCDSHKLQRQVDILDRCPDIGACVTNYHLIDEVGGEPKDYVITTRTKKLALSDIFSSHIHANSCMFRAELMRDNQFQIEVRQKHPRDYALYAELASHGIICLPFFGLTYRRCHSGVSTSVSLKDSNTLGLSQQRKIGVFNKMEEDFPNLHKAFAKARAEMNLDLYHISRVSGHKNNAFLINAIIEAPLVVLETVIGKIKKRFFYA